MAKAKQSPAARLGERTRELTRGVVRPTPEQARFSSNRGVIWTLRIVGAGVLLAAVASLVVFPVRDYVAQSATLERKISELEALADANEQLVNEVNELATTEGTRNAARSQLGYVLPGEQRMSLTPMPALPTTLPDTWPYTIISSIVALRAETANSPGAPLSPFGP